MGLTLAIVPPHQDETVGWPARLAALVPGIRVLRPETPAETAAALAEADAVYGALPPELLRQAGRVRWLQAPQAGPPAGFYHPELIAHPLRVTNMRDTYTDHVATHALALVLALARGLPRYVRAQAEGSWVPDWTPTAIQPLAESSALVVGVGALGREIGRLLAAFGVTVTGVDLHPGGQSPGFAAVRPVAELDALLPAADLVVVTVPHTPETEGLFDAARFARFRPTAHFVNIGRGATVRLEDLVSALDEGHLARAALDVFEQEPLPADHPLWRRPDVLLTPHVAGVGPHADERRFAVLAENARRFAAGQDLVNEVDKARWS
ncbi:phosphoglycerate dehydrogenase-like enzyme [Crossiella equi]|uniref:Phosphoglycerate dehydrogenase-like enzyme n=1 Tax=Crossiella equi TaxID=130796 RepID=A0ABS5A7C3_9PSEU|nr:D-2-hydroxyacid dehydrogenase [Crossiella equi]MBP2471595.1 phosphoglycerate dehydrogenase-like enzyme [Crossiella equi]